MRSLDLLLEAWKLGQNSRKSRREILEMREKMFRDLLRHAYNHSRFYRDYYQSHGIRADDLEDIPIHELPPIDKGIFIENFDDLTTREELNRRDIARFLARGQDREEKYLGRYTLVHSSGSTGPPTYFVYDPVAWRTVLAAAFRACKGEVTMPQVIAAALGRIRVMYVAATEGRFGGAMAAGAGIRGFGFRPLLLNINSPLEQWAERVRAFGPNVIIGYPSGLKILCDLVKGDKVRLEAFRVITGGEPLTRPVREYIESTLGTEVFDLYAASESLVIGLGRRRYGGMYLFDDINYVEFDEGYTYLTPLYNYSQPLIRYRLTDKLEGKARGDHEPLPYTKIERVVGRDEEMMWFINAKGGRDFLHPLVIDELEVEGMAKHQFVQRSEHSFEIRVLLQPGADLAYVERELRRQMDKILAEKELSNLRYEVRPVDDIPIDPSTGKSKMVVRRTQGPAPNAP